MKILTLIFLLFGCFVGAGFVSGKEVAVYFSVFGKNSIYGILILGVIIFFLLIFFLSLSNKVSSFNDFINKYFGKAGIFLNFLFAISMLIFIGSMFAGNYILAECLHINKILFVCVSIVLTFVFVNGNVKAMGKLNLILMPIVISILLYFTFTTNFGCGEESSFSLCVFSSISYALINIVPLGIFILDIGGEKKLSKKDIILTSLIVSLILIILLLIYNNAIILNDLQDVSMPILYLIRGNQFFLSVFALMSLYLGMLTTLISCVYVFANYLNIYIKDYKRSTMLSIFFGLIISFLGFDSIVDYVYIFIGIIGLFVVTFIMIKEIRDKIKSSLL